MTILKTTPIMEYPHTYIWMLWVGFIIVILGFTIAKATFDEFDFIPIFFSFIAIIGLIFMISGLVFEIIEPKIDTGRIKQIIKCDDTISLNEFYNKYTILEHTQYTDIYVVEEINTND